MAKYSKQRELHSTIDSLRAEVRAWQLVVLDAFRVVVDLTPEELEDMLLKPPFEMLQVVLQSEEGQERMRGWWEGIAKKVSTMPMNMTAEDVDELRLAACGAQDGGQIDRVREVLLKLYRGGRLGIPERDRLCWSCGDRYDGVTE